MQSVPKHESLPSFVIKRLEENGGIVDFSISINRKEDLKMRAIKSETLFELCVPPAEKRL
jgi:hypothetical protein